MDYGNLSQYKTEVNSVLAIRNTENGLWWSNDWGWGSFEGCFLQHNCDKEYYKLPIGGEWVEVGNFKIQEEDI